jgi:hypothetical protein
MAPYAFVGRIKRTSCIRSSYGGTTTDQKVKGLKEKNNGGFTWAWLFKAFASCKRLFVWLSK